MNHLTKAMVLAAGRGTRMRPLTDTLPKPMVQVAGQTLIERALDRVTEIGIYEAVVNLHYLGDQLRAHLKDRTSPAIQFSDESDALLETGGGVKRALPMLGEGPFLTINSDAVWIGGRALAPLPAGWQPDRMDVLLLLARKENAIGYTRSGDFRLDEDGALIRRGDAATAPYVFTGAQILNPALFEDTPDGAFSLNVVYDAAIARKRAFGVVHDGNWCDVGTPEGRDAAERALEA